MGKIFYPKLALQNIGKNARNYISYMITCVITITMFYIMSALTNASELDQFRAEGGTFISCFRAVDYRYFCLYLLFSHTALLNAEKKIWAL